MGLEQRRFTRYHKNNKFLKDSGIFMKRVTDNIKNGTKEQRSTFFVILLDTIDATLLG